MQRIIVVKLSEFYLYTYDNSVYKEVINKEFEKVIDREKVFLTRLCRRKNIDTCTCCLICICC